MCQHVLHVGLQQIDCCMVACRFANTCERLDSSQRAIIHSGWLCRSSQPYSECLHPSTCCMQRADRQHCRYSSLLWSQGSPIYKDHIAPANDALIDVLEASGAIVIGKTNTPEFGAGANTFNQYVKEPIYIWCLWTRPGTDIWKISIHYESCRHSCDALHMPCPV